MYSVTYISGKKRILARLEGIQKSRARNDSGHLVGLEKKLKTEFNEMLLQEQEEIFWFFLIKKRQGSL